MTPHPTFVRQSAPILCLIALSLGALVFRSLQRSIVLDFLAIDGDLQTWNPVFRLSHGQRLGVDFDSYLGWLMALAVQACSLCFGGGFAAVKAASCFLTGASYLGLITICLRLCRISWFWSLTAGLLAYLISSSVPAQVFFDQFKRHPLLLAYALMINVEPGISLRMLRAGLPVLAVAVLLGTDSIAARLNGWRQEVVWVVLPGLIAGTALLWSTDYGLPVAAFMVIFGGARILFLPWSKMGWRNVKRFLFRVTCTAATCLVTSYLITAVISGSFKGLALWASYIKGVSENSFWYFEGPEQKLLQWGDLRIGGLVPVAFLLGAWNLFRSWRSERPEPALITGLLGILGFTAFSVTALNVNHPHYFHPLYIATLSLLAGTVLFPLRSRIPPISSARWVIVAGALLGTILTARDYVAMKESAAKRATGSALRAASKPPLTLPEFRTAVAAAPLVYVPEIKGYLSTAYEEDVLAAREDAALLSNQPNGLYSTYSGFYETFIGAINPTRTDYLIHALGERQYVEVLDRLAKVRPQRINTINPEYVSWESWIRAQHWDLYRFLLENYEVFDTTPLYVRWRLRDQSEALPENWQNCEILQVDPGEARIVIPGFPPVAEEKKALFEVEFEYSAEGHRVFPKCFAYIEGDAARGTAGIPLGRHTRVVPVAVSSGNNAVVTIKSAPPGNTSLRIISARARRIEIPATTNSVFLGPQFQ